MEYTTQNFSTKELRCKCKHCRGEVPSQIDQEALYALQRVRVQFGKAMILNSAYRCPLHEDEAKKEKPGTHNKGTAFDIRVPWGRDRAKLLDLLRKEGFNAFGFANTFIHADFNRPVGTTWGYN